MIVKNNVFKLENVSYYYLGKITALSEITCEIERGEKIVLLGANGSGKSSLLNILDGLAFPQKGQIEFLGHRLSEEALRDEEFNGFFRRKVGLVFQNSEVQLFSSTVWDEIAFGPVQLGLSRDQVEGRVNDLLRMLEIESLRDRPPYQLSGGEKKKVAIAATLAVNPDVLLLDEPVLGLDPRTQSWFVELLEELHIAGKTIVTATHDLNIAGRISDSVIVLGEDHTIAAEGGTFEIINDKSLLLKVNIIHEHLHYHDGRVHSHLHSHFQEHDHTHANLPGPKRV